MYKVGLHQYLTPNKHQKGN